MCGCNLDNQADNDDPLRAARRLWPRDYLSANADQQQKLNRIFKSFFNSQSLHTKKHDALVLVV